MQNKVKIMMKAEKIINRMWVRSRAGTFPNGNR